MTIPFSFCLIRRRAVFSILALACLLLWTLQRVDAQAMRPLLVIGGPSCLTSCPAGPTCPPHRTWDTGSDSKVMGFNPQSIQDDLAGLTNQLSPAAPTMVTSMENTCNGSSGLLYWNPTTNAFKTYCVTRNSGGGFQFSVDLNRSTKSSAESDEKTSSAESHDSYKSHYSDKSDDSDKSHDCNNRFGGGDVWATVHSNADYAPYMNFRGSGNFTRWNVGADTATGIRVNPANGKVYFGNFGDGSSVRPEPPEIIELDPSTNIVRKWPTGNRPYQLFFDGTFVWATAVASATLPFDQILRLDPSATWGANLTRWNLPSTGSFQQSVVRGTNPNSITTDLEGKVWFAETVASKVGRLDPTANTITEYIKGSILGPQNISSSGIRATLQAFFTEGTGNAVSVLTNSIATSPAGSAGVPVRVTPSSSLVHPSTSTATPVAFTPALVATTIRPATCQVEGLDPGGIFRFPAPFANSEPAGITGVVMPQSVFGALHGSGHVFQLSSLAITAPPPSSACREEEGEADQEYAKHDGDKAHVKRHYEECEESEKKRAGDDDYKDHRNHQ